jgi:hypothetical protein
MALDSTVSVGESINCIVDAFEDSATSFREWRQRRRKRRPGESELLTSLEAGALDVRVDYEKHFRKYGTQFGAGDGMYLYPNSSCVARFLELTFRRYLQTVSCQGIPKTQSEHRACLETGCQ